MQTAIINIKADPRLKKEAQKIAGNLGLPLGTIINNYLRQFVREKKVEFKHPLIPNKKTADGIRQAAKDFKTGRNMSPVFGSVSEANDYLDSL